MPEFFVDPDGDDFWPGTERQPFATLSRAVQAAQEATGTVVVQLRAGRHVLAETLEVSTGNVVFQAYGYGTAEQEEAVVSGGRCITGWHVHDGAWLADVGELDTRQLHVDGRRAERAAIDALSGTVTSTETGYVTDVTLDWHSPADVEFVYRGVYPWTEARCAVASADTANGSTVITMAQPTFARARDLYNYAWEWQTSPGGLGIPTRLENDPAFLTDPGTFVLERSHPRHHVLRYLPRPGENPDQTLVIAPVLETLLRITGVTGAVFRGLVFADATWLRPSAEGFLHYHGGDYYLGGPVETVTIVEGQSWVTVPTETSVIPASVRVDDSTDVRFESCRFTRLGATGLGLTKSANLTVRGCDFDTLAASGITVTGSTDVLIEDNLVHHIGLDYSGSPGIAISGAQDCTVTRNHVADVPHCGIVGGPSRGTRILHNLVTDTMKTLADGGGIYLSSPQGDGPDNGALIRGNVIKDTHTPYNFGLYTDYGASWVTVENNVVMRSDNTAILHVTPPLENVVYRANLWDADPLGSNDVPEGVTYEDNTTIAEPHDLNAATHTIQSQAGLLRPR
ncbi:right-handed parallel beta-helix repeat-containing protein [Lentzea sp. NEAU-D13]|uniref:Right-handed parallel beta-helix repeat-containing protein n=1 Tax=Lentzea alba TaxID=2714351 RepID=A0A7C9VS85_9PSEU|nr:right-handed parallel beta-helix repeat-containing protein [Lentzea alba]NGY61035.1 right-handed parallel beta-helix repeat-containing protein [Lentzea alba]